METIREEIEGIENEEVQAPEEIQENRLKFDTSFLLTKTGENGIEHYLEHPLNFSKSKGLAQVLRGATGLFGALDLAIIDIVVGMLQFAKEKKKEVVSNVTTN